NHFLSARCYIFLGTPFLITCLLRVRRCAPCPVFYARNFLTACSGAVSARRAAWIWHSFSSKVWPVSNGAIDYWYCIRRILLLQRRLPLSVFSSRFFLHLVWSYYLAR